MCVGECSFVCCVCVFVRLTECVGESIVLENVCVRLGLYCTRTCMCVRVEVCIQFSVCISVCESFRETNVIVVCMCVNLEH
jgi:hypothetical protein